MKVGEIMASPVVTVIADTPAPKVAAVLGHTRLARRKGNSPEEIMEAIWVAAEMRVGGAYAHSTLALHAMGETAPHG